MSTINITLPDGSKKQLPENATAMDLARAISPKLAEAVVVARVNGHTQDLQDPLKDNDAVELLKPNSPEGLDTLRHSAEHVLATAVLHLFDGAQVTMGPKVHDGEFYYDFDVGRPMTVDDLRAIEDEMTRIISSKMPFQKSWLTKDQARKLFSDLNQRYKPEILDWIKDDQVSVYQNGDFVDLCRGPHLPHAGFIKAFKLLGVSGSYWRADASREMLQRVSGIAFSSPDDLKTYLHQIEEAKKRDHRKLGKEHDLFFVSERFESHDYPPDQAVEMVLTGSVRADLFNQAGFGATNLLDDAMVLGIKAILSDRNLKLAGVSVASHSEQNPLSADLELKIFAQLTKEQKKQLQDLETRLNKDLDGQRIRLTVEGKFTEEIGAGLVTWLPKGGRLRVIIEDLWRRMHFAGGYEMVFSPHIAKSDLWKTSGHWNFYRESMFSPMVVDGQEYLLKPMNCPFHVLAFKNSPKSYRDLPVRLAELGTVYRYELAGVMHGLMRVRGFTQDDAHLFCRWDQIDDEIDRVLAFVLQVLRVFGFSNFEVNLSTRPEKYVGDLKEWERAEQALMSAVQRQNLPYQIDAGGGAFYGPKIDVKLRDSLDRSWQCSTIQLDFNNPERFNLGFVNAQGQAERPVMIHRALLGSMERFVGILVEEFAGAFPMWLAPEQVRILTIADRHLPFAKTLHERLLQVGMRAEVSDSSEKLGAKIRNAQLEKVPLMLIVGDEEVTKEGASVRLRNGQDLGFKAMNEIVEFCLNEAKTPA